MLTSGSFKKGHEGYWSGKKNPKSEETLKKISDALIGRPLSEGHKRKISLGKIGKPHWNKGGKGLRPNYRHSEETKKKISVSHKGKIISEETRRKFSERMKGNILSEETRKKLSESQKGKKGSNWRGGLTPLNALIRNSLKYKLWREKIMKRDNWTCQQCGERGGKLEVDHKLSFSFLLRQIKIGEGIDFFDEAMNSKVLWDENNGRTLCKNCHRLTNTYGGKLRKCLEILCE